MTGYVVDASVVVKWLVLENLSEESATLLESGATLEAPELVFAEAASALWATHRRGDILADDLAEALDALQAAPITVPQSMRQLARAAAQLAVDLAHPVYDCFYLALAIQVHYPVVTADARFYHKVHRHPYLATRIVHLAEVKGRP